MESDYFLVDLGPGFEIYSDQILDILVRRRVNSIRTK